MTSGSNGSCTPSYLCTAGPGYDLCTGLGSPNVTKLIGALGGPSSQRLANISTRALVGTGGNILIPGLYISGSGTETLLIRGDGPSLTQYGVSGVLAGVAAGPALPEEVPALVELHLDAPESLAFFFG